MSRMRNRASTAIAAQRARQLAGQPTYGFFGDLLRGAGSIVGSIIPGQLDDRIIQAVLPDAPSTNRNEVIARASCPPGFQADPRTGVCQATGIGGALQRFLPGGRTGTLPITPPGQRIDAYGNAVMGAFGQPALQPAQAQQVALRCPPGMVLGKDNLCYAKSAIRNTDRKWPKAPKPPISRKDWKALMTADRVRNKAKDIAGKAGYSCRKR